MKKLYALVKDPYNNNTVSLIERDDYNTKAAFKADLKANGYVVKRISTVRDMYCLEHGYESFRAMFPKCILDMYFEDPELWKSEIADYEAVKAMEH